MRVHLRQRTNPSGLHVADALLEAGDRFVSVNQRPHRLQQKLVLGAIVSAGEFVTDQSIEFGGKCVTHESEPVLRWEIIATWIMLQHIALVDSAKRWTEISEPRLIC